MPSIINCSPNQRKECYANKKAFSLFSFIFFCMWWCVWLRKAAYLHYSAHWAPHFIYSSHNYLCTWSVSPFIYKRDKDKKALHFLSAYKCIQFPCYHIYITLKVNYIHIILFFFFPQSLSLEVRLYRLVRWPRSIGTRGRIWRQKETP